MRRRIRLGSSLRAVVIVSLTAALLGGGVLAASHLLRSRGLPKAPAAATVTPTVNPTTSTPQPTLSPSPDLAAWVARSIPIGSVGAIALAPNAVYVIYTKDQPAGSYDPALARVASIDRSTGAVHDGGAFPGAQSLVLAGGYLWVASGTSAGVSPSATNVLYRVDASSLAVEQRSSLASLASNGNYEPPTLAASGSVLWIGYSIHVARLDATTGTVLHNSIIGNPGAGVSSLSIDPSGSRLYVGMAGDVPTGVSVAELDSTTGAAIASTSAYYGGDLGGPKLAAVGNGLWVAYATGMNGTAVELRASDLGPVANTPSEHSNGIEVFTGGAILWLTDGMADELFCADPATGATRASVSWPNGGLVAADSSGAVLGGVNGVSFLRPDPRCQAS